MKNRSKGSVKIFIAIILGIGAAVFLYFYRPSEIYRDITNKKNEIENNYQNSHQDDPVITPDYVLLDVPFYSQAPTAKWSDPRQQDGCEEASIMMAHLWLTKTSLTAQQAEQTIIDISEYEKDKYGAYVDRSITDTGKLMEEYYGHKNYKIVRNITADDIKAELAKGNLVIVPTNGQILDNPNYTGAGPITHMIPIIGYDNAKGQFITNDPGTRNGRQFRFTYENMMDSIYDYQTGAHEGYEKTETIMMVVEKA